MCDLWSPLRYVIKLQFFTVDVIYDYKAELTGIGIRSFINNFDSYTLYKLYFM